MAILAASIGKVGWGGAIQPKTSAYVPDGRMGGRPATRGGGAIRETKQNSSLYVVALWEGAVEIFLKMLLKDFNM